MKPAYAKSVIPSKYMKALKKYRAEGDDLSITRKYILNHFYEWLMRNVVPISIAPNMITLIGFILMLLSSTITAIHSPNLTERLPGWVFLLNATCLFLYQTLDNLDGKQARKTGTSSPLGELFDHGCDALASTLGTFCWLATCAQGGGATSYLIMLNACIPFVFATWEEYYIGGLYLGYINGPVEGILGVIMTQLLSFYYGAEFFHQNFSTFVYDFISKDASKLLGSSVASQPLWLCLCSLTLCLASINVLLNTINVVSKIRENKIRPTNPDAETSILNTVTKLVPFIILLGGNLAWIIFSTTGIMKQHPYLLFYCSGISFGYLASNITLSYLLKSPLKSFSIINLPLCFALLNLAVTHYTGKLFIEERFFLYICAVWVTVIYYNFVMSVCHQVSSYLGFFVLSIKPKPAKINQE
ncbi:ethanolaminephosphotransferase [Acrasis kona]|uniref:Ethanolaminephosphotransferase n=1 Tax=Acrasis kona TaxID=1008807 RepID=A0AAW2YZ51_9EUKA